MYINRKVRIADNCVIFHVLYSISASKCSCYYLNQCSVNPFITRNYFASDIFIFWLLLNLYQSFVWTVASPMKWNKLIGVLGHDSALWAYTGPETNWANDINFVMNHAPGAGSIARPVDQQSNALPLNHECPLSQPRSTFFVHIHGTKYQVIRKISTCNYL